MYSGNGEEIERIMKKRKPYNPNKSLALYARQLLKNKAVLRVIGANPNAIMYNLSTMREHVTTATDARVIEQLAWPWHVECSVLCREQTGREYIVSLPLQCETPYKQSEPDLLAFFNETHQELIKKQNPMHVITAAWLAVPRVVNECVDLPIEKLEQIYRDCGGFEFLSKWESEK